MGAYDRYVLPWLLHLVLQNRIFEPYRRQTVAEAAGRVLEIGIGSGLNLPYYGARVEVLYGVEPSESLLRRAQKRSAGLPFRVELMAQSAELLPLPEASIDTAVTTWTLCTIPDAQAALRELRRVLKPGGKIRFVEHGLSPEPRVAAWQHRITPVWKHVAGGCHLDRPIETMLRTAGFTLTRIATTYNKGPRPWSYFYIGEAISPADRAAATP